MSFKFRRDGAVFPTEVTDGALHIYMGPLKVKVPFKFLVGEEYCYDNTEFPMSNIMCLLKGDNGAIVMRFDGTVTKFDKDMNVIGFSKFNKEDIYTYTQYIPVGTHGTADETGVHQHLMCTIYTVPNSGFFILECIGDPEPIVFWPDSNPEFINDIMLGNRYYPRLIKVATNTYQEDSGRYTVTGKVMQTTGYTEI